MAAMALPAEWVCCWARHADDAHAHAAFFFLPRSRARLVDSFVKTKRKRGLFFCAVIFFSFSFPSPNVPAAGTEIRRRGGASGTRTGTDGDGEGSDRVAHTTGSRTTNSHSGRERPNDDLCLLYTRWSPYHVARVPTDHRVASFPVFSERDDRSASSSSICVSRQTSPLPRGRERFPWIPLRPPAHDPLRTRAQR